MNPRSAPISFGVASGSGADGAEERASFGEEKAAPRDLRVLQLRALQWKV